MEGVFSLVNFPRGTCFRISHQANSQSILQFQTYRWRTVNTGLNHIF